MTAWVLVLAGVTAGDGGMGTGTAASPVAVELSGRWVGTYQEEGFKPEPAELDRGVLRVGPNRMPLRCRFRTQTAGGLQGTVIIVPGPPLGVPVGEIAAVYKLERGRLVICVSETYDLPAAFGVTRTTSLLVLKLAEARKP
jgi:hypothetical protein